VKARPKTKEWPPSLLDYFEAPEGFVGRFGWVCGYSADSIFLDQALERFTRLIAARRAFEGQIALALMLDPGNPQISPVEVPGMLHLPLLRTAERNFALLHAKVALLGFRHERDAKRWRLRLIVSTGNWTRQTLDESLDLAWHVDLDRDALSEGGTKARQIRADVAAASDLLKGLRDQFEAKALTRGRSLHALQDFDGWLTEWPVGAASEPSRFFDNRRASLLAQLPRQVDLVSSKDVARNYIGMGSGFYEGVENAAEGPRVPSRIVEHLQAGHRGTPLLTTTPEVNLFVNPLACQGVAALAKKPPPRWTVRLPFAPDAPPWRKRALHAKFIFSANWRQDSENCASAWLYLGSGNLTHPGFVSAAARGRGNLEAGVVVAAEELCWAELTHRLPVDDLSGDQTLNLEELAPGAEMEERPDAFVALPVSHLSATVEGSECWLTYEDAAGPFEVLDPSGLACPLLNGRGFAWPGLPPRQARLRWIDDDETREALVAVVDPFGRLAGSVLPTLDLEGVWSHLSDFPLPPPDEELEEPEGTSDMGEIGAASASGSVPGGYSIRRLMTLIENIASLQEELPATDWTTWCLRLQQTLTLASKCEDAEYCRRIGLNLLSPLRRPEFRPEFARDRTTPNGELYECCLTTAERAWRVDGLPPLEDLP
jgi:hypothetical protein